MMTLTIADDPELESLLRREAEAKGMPTEEVIRRALREAFIPSVRDSRRRDLSDIAGVWSDQEAREFDEAVEVFALIDEEQVNE